MNPALNIKIRVLRDILLRQLKTNVQKQHTMKQNPNQTREVHNPFSTKAKFSNLQENETEQNKKTTKKKVGKSHCFSSP